MPMNIRFAACLLSTLAVPALAQTSVADNDAPVVPQVVRRDIARPHFPSNDFEIGLFSGVYEMQSFGSSAVYGLRLGYHVTEDVFVEGAYGQTQVSDETFRQIFPGGGVFPTPTQKLTYYNLSAGYNVLPGEVFFGKNVAKASAFYVIAGVGSTRFVDQNKQTLNLGFGTRLLFNDRVAVQADVRDHVFSFDLLGKRQSAKNLEVTAGVTVYF
jgi:outer membrane beta-barrel protein